MKIAILNSYIFPIPAVKGGAVETLIESFIKCANQDKINDVTVFSLWDKEAEIAAQAYPNIRFKWLKRPSWINAIDRGLTNVLRILKRDKDIWQKNYIWQELAKLYTRQALLEEDYDIVLIENAIFLPSLFENRRLRKKYVGKVYFHSHNIHFRQVSENPVLAGVIMISNFLEKNTRQVFGDTIPFSVVYNGVTVEDLDKSIDLDCLMQLREQLDIPVTSPVILYVGRIMTKKGVRELLQAFLKLEHMEAHLVLVGSSSFGLDELTGFEKEIAQVVENNARIHATGFIGKADLGVYYALADVVVLPSIWEEPLGLTMIEAQLAGRPLVTTNKGGIPETTNADYSCILDVNEQLIDNLANAIDNVLTNQVDWEVKAEIARRQALYRFNETRYYRAMKSALGLDSDDSG
ncbi:glycosyltransferase family 4 protein [Streptococcus suis]